MAWMVDWQAALDAGMAIRIPKPEEPIEDLVVVGLHSSADGGAGAAELGTLLTGHRYTVGAALLAQGTPTNATEGRPEPDDAGTLAAALAGPTDPDPASDGARLAAALGVDPTILAGVAGAGGRENEEAQAANVLFWTCGWGLPAQ